MRIFLVGYMFSGKSTVGKKLAKILNFKFIDTDHAFESLYGYTIEECINLHGEDFFRQKEKEVLFNSLMMNNVVIATGGGTPCFFDQIDLMNNEGIVVYLQASESLIINRMLNAKQERPLLKGLSLEQKREKIKQHLNVRLPIYEQASVIVPAENVNIEFLAKDLMQKGREVSFV